MSHPPNKLRPSRNVREEYYAGYRKTFIGGKYVGRRHKRAYYSGLRKRNWL